jgi:hypothetical protein
MGSDGIERENWGFLGKMRKVKSNHYISVIYETGL